MNLLMLELPSANVPTRLHRHAIFGKVPVSDTCRTIIPIRLVGLWCPSGVFFFHFSDTAPTRLCNGLDTMDMPAVTKLEKKKIHRFWQMDKLLPLILWYTLKQKILSLRSEKWEIITVKPTAPTLLLLAALYPSPALDRADQRVSELHRQQLM